VDYKDVMEVLKSVDIFGVENHLHALDALYFLDLRERGTDRKRERWREGGRECVSVQRSEGMRGSEDTTQNTSPHTNHVLLHTRVIAEHVQRLLNRPSLSIILQQHCK